VAGDLNPAKRALLRATCTPGTTYQLGLNKAITGVGTGSAVDHALFSGTPVARVARASDYANTVTVHVYY